MGRPGVTVGEMNPADSDILTQTEELPSPAAAAGLEEIQRKPTNIQHR